MSEYLTQQRSQGQPRPRAIPWVALAAVAVTAIAAMVALAVWQPGGNLSAVPPEPAAAPKANLALPQEEAKYLQDVEHLGGFVLGDKTFPLVAQAIRQSDAEALRQFLDPQFQGRLFDRSAGVAVEHSSTQLRLWSEQRDARTELDRDGFVRELVDYRNEFDELLACQLKVMLMSPVTYKELAGPWEGTCKLRLAGRTKDGRVAEVLMKLRCTVTEITDETPERGGWLKSAEAFAAGTTRAGEFLMQEMTAETGLAADALRDNWKSDRSGTIPFLTGGVCLADYNQDGWMDALITDFNGNALYQGVEGGKFVDVTDQVALPRNTDAHTSDGAVFADLDEDGFEDLLIGSRIYQNEVGRRFRELVPGKDTTLRLADDAQQFAVADYDRDGKLDLYVIGMSDPTLAPGEVAQAWIGTNDGKRNQLWRNLGRWRFEDVTDQSGTAGNGAQAFAAVWFDADGDDWPDLMTSCEMGTNDYFINQGDGTFRSGPKPDGYGGFSMGITVGDIDNDGFADPYVANMYSKAGERIIANLHPGLYPSDVDAKLRDCVSGNELYLNRGDGSFDRIGKSSGVSDVGWAYGAGYMDLNSDGLLDIYAPVGFQSVSADKPDG